MSPEPEYRGLMARSWDRLRGDTSAWPDRDFYRALIAEGGGPALDVGCGTGRLLLDYLAEGLDVDGVDNAPDMLAICRAKAAAAGLDLDGRVHQQAMEALGLPRRYGTILVPSSSFQLLTDPAAATDALTRFRDHLAPGGLLVMSIMSKLWPGRRKPPHLQWTDWFKLGECPWDGDGEGDGATLRRWTRACFDHDEQLEHEENRFEVVRDGEIIETETDLRSPSTRWYSQDQALALCDRAGFAKAQATAGFTFAPATPDDTTFCVIARG